MRTTLATGAAMRMHLTPAEMRDLPEALHAAAFGTWTPPEAPSYGARMLNAGADGIDEAGELGQVWRVDHRGLTVLLAIAPGGARGSWAMLEGDDLLDTGHRAGPLEVGFAMGMIDEECAWRRVQAVDARATS